MIAVFKREFKSYFTGMMGYVFIAFVLLFIGIYTSALNLKYAYPGFEYVIKSSTFMFLIAVPVLTMRVFAEERKQNTDQLLYSLPISVLDMVLGKYFAMVALMAIPMAVVSFYPLLVGSFGTISYASAYSSIFAFFLLGCALIAVGMFMSSITENQLIAAVMCLGTLILCYLMTALSNLMTSTALASTLSLMIVALLLSLIVRLMTKSWTAAGLTAVITFVPLALLYLISPTAIAGAFTKALGALAIFDRMDNFTNGIFDLTGLVYFISVAALFCFFTVQAVEKRRWS
ncbi:MAG TPA: ABC transporter [Candidatus Limiplasma sp.]|nr:ABC transporter [Candidatus Limiplasma sp.]HPS81387.1 ABC transporter [Candidatus Limiplasma sp.]